jgi:hypothetical protein
MQIIDTSALFHTKLINYWRTEHEVYERSRHNALNRFDRAAGGLERGDGSRRCNGDRILERLIDVFLNGFGVIWSSVQIKIFHALVDAVLPRIYNEEWEEVKGRVMVQRKIDRIYQEVLITMGRRNGKTWLTSGTAAAMFLTIPEITIAVFSVGKRQAELFMGAAVEKIELAFSRGTHVKKSDYNVVRNSQEMLVYEHPMGGKQVLGCYPGSSKVSESSPFHPPFLDISQELQCFLGIIVHNCNTVKMSNIQSTPKTIIHLLDPIIGALDAANLHVLDGLNEGNGSHHFSEARREIERVKRGLQGALAHTETYLKQVNSMTGPRVCQKCQNVASFIEEGTGTPYCSLACQARK